MSLRDKVRAVNQRSRDQTQAETQQKWEDWMRTPEALVSILKCPELAIPPRLRRATDILNIIRSGAWPALQEDTRG